MNYSQLSANVDVAVLGAGISGLTAGYYAKKSGKTVRILEASARVGGAIRSEKKEGYLLEYGPNTVMPTVELMELIHELDLGSQMLLGDAKLPRFIQNQGRLFQVPMSASSFFKSSLLSRGGRIRLLAEPLIPRGHQNGEESLMKFAQRRLGPEAAEKLMAPFVSGVWAGDPNQLSAAASFPKQVGWEKEKGSLLRGIIAEKRRMKKEKVLATPRGLLSFNNGLETLPLMLAKNLSSEISLYSPISRLTREGDRWILDGPGFQFSANQIIFSIPAPQAAASLDSNLFNGGTRPASDFSEAVAALREIPYAPLAVVHLSVKTSEVKCDLHAFGHLIAPSENLETLGCLYSSSIFSNRAPKDTALLTVFVGGARFPQILHLSDQELLKKAVLALQPIMDFQKHPDLIALTRYERAIPQYTIGHINRLKILKATETKFPGLKFAGNFIGGISVGDVVRHAKNVATA